jgi:hypothetical protein
MLPVYTLVDTRLCINVEQRVRDKLLSELDSPGMKSAVVTTVPCPAVCCRIYRACTSTAARQAAVNGFTPQGQTRVKRHILTVLFDPVGL